MSETGRGNLGEYWYGSRKPPGGTARGTGPLERSRTGRGSFRRSGTVCEIYWEVQDGSVDPQEGSGRVGGPTRRSRTGRGPWGGPGQVKGASRSTGTGRGTLGEVWNGSGDTSGGPEWLGGPSVRSRTGRKHSWRSGTGRVTHPEIRDGSGDPQGGPGRVEGLGEVRDRSREPPGAPGRVGEPSVRSGTGQETLLEVQNGSGDHR